VQYPAEVHIVSAVALGEAPEWGCDKYWATGLDSDLEFSRCIAVFGVFYVLGNSSPKW
jgi:hypothetical protein